MYKIGNNLNGKVYIGQTIKPEYRWYQHRSYAQKENKHKQYIHSAMAKYGVDNFTFEVIATCKTQEDADEIESILILQYNSRSKEYGYNLKAGGNSSPHSEETKQKQREATLKQIEDKGHPAQGKKWTDDQKTKLSQSLKALDKEAIYTEAVRKNMSEAHLGIKDTEETKQKKAESAKAAWDKRLEQATTSGELKCNAPGCDIKGKAAYKFIDGIRYCNKHGLRLLRYGRLDRLRAQ
jgi:group I intron endonuclease